MAPAAEATLCPAEAAEGSLRDRALLQVVVTRAVAALDAGDPRAALDQVREGASLAAASDVGCYVFGLISFNAQETDGALAWFERALSLRPDFPDALAGHAVALHRLGRPQEALGSFEKILRHRPEDTEALYMCGVVLQGLGRPDDALALYDRALHLRPAYAEALLNRGALLERAGRYEAALASFDAALAAKAGDGTILFNRGTVLQKLGRDEEALAAYGAAARDGAPDPEVALNRGNVLQRLGRFDEALAAYDTALGLRTAYPQAHYNRAIALQATGHVEAALAAYDAALALAPDYAEAHCNRGNALHELGQTGAALLAYEAALKLDPSLVQALTNRANVLLQRGRAAEALTACDEALRHRPGHAQALCLRGAALHCEGRFAEALAALDAALHARPDYPEALLNRGNALQECDRIEEAITSYDTALAHRPNYAEALSGRGVALKELGRLDAALTSFDAALRQKPGYPDARNNRAGARLLRGDLIAGFEDYESRWERGNAPRKALLAPYPTWRGQPVAGERMIVWDEQGLGDLIQFCRYLPLLAEAGADVTFLCRASMHRLLGSLPKAIRLIETPDRTEGFAFQSALMSLPHGFHTTLDTIPAPVAYLQPEAERVARWAERIGSGGFRIGICWHGNRAINLHRTVPLRFFAALAAVPGVRLISLMKDTQPDDGAGLPVETLGETFDAGPHAFVDTAAVMANLDLVVSSDTSVAHLAGALGRPVYLALKQVPDWRWLIDRPDSPWYPTMRLFRQKSRGAWGPVFDDIADAVANRIRAKDHAGRIALPAGVGDLIDKITILEIKAEAIADPDKLAHVRHELSLLRRLKAECAFGGRPLAELETELKAANAALWGIEDALRGHEERLDFGDAFVALAREVYKTNDRRAALKRQINTLFHSSIVEEKSYAAQA